MQKFNEEGSFRRRKDQNSSQRAVPNGSTALYTSRNKRKLDKELRMKIETCQTVISTGRNKRNQGRELQLKKIELLPVILPVE